MKVLQSFKKGVAHTLCCTPSFGGPAAHRTLLSYTCGESERLRVARMEDAATFTPSLHFLAILQQFSAATFKLFRQITTISA
ncbi:hypothetical protein E2C01_033397 [Portunus trituberculatus]|uniref:Uncharacterized protein n=1 Tax=Portunus trituberculatus TaxID=210409 RepID=A0A5B7F2U3_PORTR|nr:hypothetical protein [Portunus trituberculatus]